MVCGCSLVITILLPTSAFVRVDLPAFGRPTKQQNLLAAEARLRELSRLNRGASPFVLAVLEQLEIFGSGRNVVDAQAVAGRIPGILAELSLRDVIDAASTGDDVAEQAMPDVARYIAASLASPQAYAVMQDAERRLRRLRPDEPSYEPARMSAW